MKRFFQQAALAVVIYSAAFSTAVSQGTLVNWNTIPKSGTALVLTHMDDDLIWMLPWWNITEKFISGAMPPTPVYQTVVDQQQEYLDANGYNINYKDNWITPWGWITQQQYSDYYWDNKASAQYLAADHLIAYWDDNDAALVRTEINRLKAKLEQYIASPSISRLITHNNWGEYGHQQHRAINKAIRELAVKYRKDVWMLGTDNGDFVDVDVPNGITYTLGSFNDPTLFTSIRTIYKNNWCWTWPDMVPSGDHKFIKIVESGVDKSNILTGESVTVSGPAQAATGSYIFDGVDDYMTLWGNASSAFTIAMKVRPDVIRYMDISKMTEYPGNATSDRNFILNADGKVSARIYDGSSRVLTSTSSISSGNWTHITMTGNGTSLKIYINGILEGTLATGSAITSYSSAEFVMGQTGITSSFFSGQIAEVNLYDRALSDAEVATLSGVTYRLTASAGTGGTISPNGQVTVALGSNQTFSIVPGGAYLIDDVKIDGVSAGAISTYTFSNVHADHTISATFAAKATHTITAAASSNGSISPSGAVAVAEGTNQTFTITPNAGYAITDVLVDGSSAGAVTSYTFTNVQTDHTISASYHVVPTHTITATAGSGGSVSPTGTVTVNEGSNQTFTITPNSGYRITGVTVDGAAAGVITTYTFTNVTVNHTISAAFEAIPVYTINASAGTGGSISPSGAVSVTEGSGRTFNITPNAGYTISNVLVDGVSAGTVSTYTFSNVTDNHTIAVSFSVITYTITSSSGSGGTISPSGSVSVNYGSSRTFNIVPDAGYALSTLRVDNVLVTNSSSYTFSNITANHTIAVTFSPIVYTITASAGTGGSVSPSGAVSVNWGTGRSFSITPNTGYYISDVRVDNASVGAVSTYSFSNVTANHTISATFAIYTFAITGSAGSGGSISPAGSTSVNYGASQAYTITPSAGYGIADVLADNVSVGAVSGYTFSNVTAAHTISATFSRLFFNITASSGTGGSVTPDGTVSAEYGSSQVYTITPAEGYNITNVLVDNIAVGPVTSYTFSNITSAHTISASFTLKQYTIAASAGQGGSLSPSGTLTVNHGSSQGYSVIPQTGYSITDVRVDGISQGAISSYSFSNITENHTIEAEFSLIQYTIDASAGEGGSITPSGISGVGYGDSRSYEIVPDEGHYISEVLVDGTSVGIPGNYTFGNITSDHTITAHFALIQYTITVNCGANGNITPGDGTMVGWGESRTFSVVPSFGYKITGVTVDEVPVGAVTSYTFENVLGDHTITAEFEVVNMYTIRASAGTGGSITPKGDVVLPEESSQTYSIEPSAGYRILSVVVDNVDLGSVDEYLFSNILSDHSIKAEFTSETVVKVFPNPFRENFKVTIESPLRGNFEMYIFDTASRLVWSDKNVDPADEINVNLSGSARGIYIVRLYYDKVEVSTHKVIKY